MRKLLIIVLILALTLSGVKESPLSREIKNMEFSELEWELPEVGDEIKLINLESGAKLFLKENHTIPLIEITIYIKGGSYYLPSGHRGVPELFTRTLERGGTRNLTPEDFTLKQEINAINFNVKDEGFYYSVSQLTNSTIIDTALTLLEEALFHPRFDSKIMNIEKERLAEDWKKKLDNPGSLLREISHHVLYRGHPAGAIPDFNRVNSTKKEGLERLHERFIQPENMIIGIVGDFDTENMMNRIRTIFADKYNTGKDIGKIQPLNESPEKKVYFYDMKIPQGYFYIQHRGRKAPFPGMYNVMIMNQILGGGGFNSRIVLKVRNEMGLAYSTRSRYSMFNLPCGYFSAYSATRSNSTHLASKYIIKEIKRIRNEKVSQEELKRAIDSYVNSLITGLGNDWQYIPRLMEMMILGMPVDYYINLKENIENVNREDALKAAQDFIIPEKLHMVIVGDREKIEVDSLKNQFDEVEFMDYKIPGI